ncbi:MAG: transglycosylase domain-containing protein [Betaproteobacteria bacterium]
MKKFFFAGFALLAISGLIILLWFFVILRNLPDVSALKRYRPAAASEVLDSEGKVLTQYYERKFRIWIPISALPDVVIQAVVIAEDDTFFEHRGVNYKATWDALVHDVKKRRFARGGSTITQQMIKNVLLSKEKTISRKLREYVLARKAEEILSKRRILEIYLNEVEWGENIYGIEAASRYYLDKHALELTAGEAALLAGMLPNPRYYNPFKRLKKAKHRQGQVLFNIHQAKILTDEEYTAALEAPIELRQEGSGRFDFSALTDGNGRPCYQHALEQMLVNLFGEHALYNSGLVIQTTLDKTIQEDLSRWEESLQDKTAGSRSMVTVVKQGDVIRAIVCAEGKEAEIRSKFESPGMPFSGYDVAVVSPDAVSREQIILTPSRARTTSAH